MRRLLLAVAVLAASLAPEFIFVAFTDTPAKFYVQSKLGSRFVPELFEGAKVLIDDAASSLSLVSKAFAAEQNTKVFLQGTPPQTRHAEAVDVNRELKGDRLTPGTLATQYQGLLPDSTPSKEDEHGCDCGGDLTPNDVVLLRFPKQ